MNDDYTNLYLETFNEGEKITIDWGDGSGEECVPVRHEGDSEVWYEIEAEHTYAGKSSHTVTVKGKIKGCDIYDCEVTSIDVTKCPALEYLYCYGNQLTSLDVSKNTVLKDLSCSENQLTSLDISKNTALEYLDCSDNQFSASAMNKIYNDLPVVKDGCLSCDRLGDYSIAENKGWYVRFGY